MSEGRILGDKVGDDLQGRDLLRLGREVGFVLPGAGEGEHHACIYGTPGTDQDAYRPGDRSQREAHIPGLQTDHPQGTR